MLSDCPTVRFCVKSNRRKFTEDALGTFGQPSSNLHDIMHHAAICHHASIEMRCLQSAVLNETIDNTDTNSFCILRLRQSATDTHIAIDKPTVMKFLRLFVAMCFIFQISGFAPSKLHLSSASKSIHNLEMNSMKKFVVGGLLAVTILLPFQNAFAETIMEKNANFVYKLPPIDRKNPDRCKLMSSSIGQANAARDSLYDLRECDIRGQNAEGKDQSGMIASDVSSRILTWPTPNCHNFTQTKNIIHPAG